MVEIIQGTPEWFEIRCGKLTASRMADATAKTKTGWGAGRKNLMAQLVAERLTGTVAESFSNTAMQWGKDIEPEARAAYEFYHDVDVVEIGFVDHPFIPMTGASPDGLIGQFGMVEIKCPNTSTHIETLLSGKIPAKYTNQMTWQMVCASRIWCDFVSYDPRLPEEMKMFVSRCNLDRDLEKEIAINATEFLKELDAQVSELKSKYQQEQEPNILLAG
jgi:putative phage-type endonuclease